jgi:hypothetical protein
VFYVFLIEGIAQEAEFLWIVTDGIWRALGALIANLVLWSGISLNCYNREEILLEVMNNTNTIQKIYQKVQWGIQSDYFRRN